MCEKNNKRGVDLPISVRRAAQAVRVGVAKVWPSCCVICRRHSPSSLDLCEACLGWFPTLSGAHDSQCRHCGEVFPEHLSDACCRACAELVSPFARLVVPWRYAFPVDRLIQRMKYRDERVLARVFGSVLACEARVGGVPLPDCLLAVPSRAGRVADGFDHAVELTRWCARELSLPAPERLAERIVDTGSLAGLSRAERALRIRGAFRVDARLADRHVAIVDDVLTTGATAGEFARELYDTGALSVELWVLARTPTVPFASAPS